ncbi:MAG: hypothetical protein GJ680_19555 [Alteromonadaceae bacterium]|nr:hypothetical protein [Alteromonadaceae bacterium]
MARYVVIATNIQRVLFLVTNVLQGGCRLGAIVVLGQLLFGGERASGMHWVVLLETDLSAHLVSWH